MLTTQKRETACKCMHMERFKILQLALGIPSMRLPSLLTGTATITVICLCNSFCMETNWKAHTQPVDDNTSQFPHVISEIEGNMTMSAVMTLREVLTKCQTITIIMSSSDELPWLPSQLSQKISKWTADTELQHICDCIWLSTIAQWQVKCLKRFLLTYQNLMQMS